RVFHSLFEAARWAASAFNEQPWRFIAVRRGENTFSKMADCLAPGNKSWAAHAAFLIMVIAKKEVTRNGAHNRHAGHDTGLAIGNLSVQATAAGIALHQMGGFDLAKATVEFGVPEGFEPLTIIAGGYPGDPETLSEDLRERETAARSRKTLDEIVFFEKFGQPHPLFIANISGN
ncbi:MAG: nitroreductase family protein, partial [Bacteroidota bacterium]